MGEVCRVIEFNTRLKVVNDNTKLKKDGTPKNTVSNSRKDREEGEPFKPEDVEKLIKYFKDKLDESKTDSKLYANYRNFAIFVMGINIGLRVSDLLRLKWSTLYNDKWEFYDYKTITPKKTEYANKKVLLSYNPSFRIITDEFRTLIGVKNTDEFIFKKTLNKSEAISYERVYQMLKEAANEVGITYPIGTHSWRKTFARQRYENAVDKKEVLINLMEIFNHSSQRITLNYIGITKEEKIQLYNDVSLGYGQLKEFYPKSKW